MGWFRTSGSSTATQLLKRSTLIENLPTPVSEREGDISTVWSGGAYLKIRT
jgi:hypothetical protein